MNHNAIRKVYPEVITIDDSLGCFDASGNLIEIDNKRVKAAAVILEKEKESEAQARATAKAELLERLGITADEAKLLLA